MSERTPKEKYLIDDESIDEEIVTEEEKEEEEDKLSEAEIQERIKKNQALKEKRKREKIQKKETAQNFKEDLENRIIKVLKKGKVDSKFSLTHLLIKDGIQDYHFRINLIENKLTPEIPYIGNVLKKLRFSHSIFFSVNNGAHVYYTDINQKLLKIKEQKIKFDWKSYVIPKGNNEIYLIFKVPGREVNTHHLLSSCYPEASLSNFYLKVDKKYENTSSFTIYSNKLTGYFDEDKLILKCITSDVNRTKTLYKLIQIGRKIIKELLKLNLRYSEALTIINQNNSLFVPFLTVFRAKERDAFYSSKFTNALRGIYDFPEVFDKKIIYGKYSAISKEEDDKDFDIKDFYEFFEKSCNFQTKAFISNAILKDWIINPNKAINYIEKDDEMKNLITEYLQEIDTDRIIQDKVESSMEKGEFVKDMTTNLLLTLLGLSIIADWAPFQWAIIGVFVIINAYYLYIKTRKRKKIIY